MSLAQQQPPSDVWEQPFAMQPFSEYFKITNLDVAGVSSLALGAIYLFSFMYYHYILEQEQSRALAKQNAKAAQQQQEDAQEETLQIATEIHEVPSVKEEEMVMSSHNVFAVVPVLNPDEEMDVKKARAAVERAKKFHFAARMQERKRKEAEQSMEMHQNEMQEEIVPTKRRRGRLWRWLRRSEESG
jgi:hypothetical protein